jgi:hypothetical protein
VLGDTDAVTTSYEITIRGVPSLYPIVGLLVTELPK